MYGGHTFKTRVLLIAALLILCCTAPAAASTPGSLVSSVYEFSGAPESFLVPEGVGAIGVSALGANGGYGGIYVELVNAIPHDITRELASATPADGTHGGSFAPGGSGGEANASIPVSAGQTLSVNVGGAGESVESPTRGYGGPPGVEPLAVSGFTPPLTPGAAGGYGGGGEGGGSEYRYSAERTGLFFGGGGGGASTVSLSSTPLLVAGGGGGGGGNGGGRNGSDAVQVQPDTLYEVDGNGGGGGLRELVPNLNIGDLAIVSVNWVAYQPNDMPATPAGWTLLDSASYGEVGELGNAYGTHTSAVSYAYVSTYVKLITEPGTEESLFIVFPHKSVIFNMLGFGVSGTDPSEPILSHDLDIDTTRSGTESFPATPVGRDHSAVLSITSFPVDLPSEGECPVESIASTPLDSGSFGRLDFCSESPPSGVNYANDVSSGTFPAVSANWPGYNDALAGEEIVLQPPAGAGARVGPLPSAGGGGGGSNAEMGAGEAGTPGTLDTSESERGLGGAGGSESTPGVTEAGEPGQSDGSSDDPEDEGGFTGGGGGGGYYGGLGGAFAVCEFEPCAIRGAGGGGGGSDYAVTGASGVLFKRAANSASSEGNGQVTITYYTPYPTSTSASVSPPNAYTGSSVTLSAEIKAKGACAGTVQFTIDGKDVGSAVAVTSNVAEEQFSAPAAGTHQVSAVYSGSLSTASQAGCLPSTSAPSTLSVLYPTSTQATPTPSSASVGETITITATVTSTITCTGTVQFEIDGRPIGSPVPVTEGKAQTTIPAPVAGQHPITATYSGTPSTATQAGCLPSTSAPSTLSVGSEPPATITSEGLVATKPVLACASVRQFVIHLQIPKQQRLIGTNIYVNGRLVKHLGPATRAYLLNLHGRPYSTVTITLTAREPDGHLISGKRIYHTCRPHPLPGHTKLNI